MTKVYVKAQTLLLRALEAAAAKGVYVSDDALAGAAGVTRKSLKTHISLLRAEYTIKRVKGVGYVLGDKTPSVRRKKPTSKSEVAMHEPSADDGFDYKPQHPRAGGDPLLEALCKHHPELM